MIQNIERRQFLKKTGVISLGICTIPFLPACKEEPGFQSMNSFIKLARSTPEDQGVSSQAISNFLEAANKSELEFHSIMILRNAHVIAEGWWSPFAPEYKHTLYSLSKSFTSTAIGLVIDEGKLSVEDPVISFFPSDLPTDVADNLASMKVRHLLTMNTGHDVKPMPRMQEAKDGNWAKVFLAAPVIHEPGSHFLYNTGATYMLSVIVQKLTGKTVLEYLNIKLFPQLNIQDADWELDPNGICVGGYGLRLKTEDIANFGQLYLQKGNWNGQQIISESWIDEATKKQTTSQSGDNDWAQGYGYQFWRCKPEPGFYRGDGAFGQYCIVIPQYDAVIAVTSESSDMQASMNLIWEHILPALEEGIPKVPDQKNHQILKSSLASLSLPTLPIDQGLSPQLPDKIFNLKNNPSKANTISFSSNTERCTVTIEFDDHKETINCGFGKWLIEKNKLSIAGSLFVIPENLNSKVAACAAWKDDQTLLLKLIFIEGIHSDNWICQFDGDNISISFENSVAKLQGRTDERIPWVGNILTG